MHREVITYNGETFEIETFDTIVVLGSKKELKQIEALLKEDEQNKENKGGKYMNIPKTIQYNGITLTYIQTIKGLKMYCNQCNKYRQTVLEYAKHPEDVGTNYDPEYYHFGTECIKEVIKGGVNGNTDI